MNKCKSIIIALIIATSMTITTFGQNIFEIKSVIGTPEKSTTCTISAVAGEVLNFSAIDIERRLGLNKNSLDGLTITALPTSMQGGLFLDGVEVSNYDYLERVELDRLCFVPAEEVSIANISFLPQSKNAVSTQMAIRVLAAPNAPPSIEDSMIETAKNVPIKGKINAKDPEGGYINYQIISKPTKGEVIISGNSYTYTPYRNKEGSDSFTICAIDNATAYSREATININIENSNNTFVYADMVGNPSSYATIKLREKNILTGEIVGNRSFFHPDSMTTRGDFLILLIAASGLESDLKPTVNTDLPNDAEIPKYLKPYVAAAVRAKIIPKNVKFEHNQFPMRSEAVVLTARAAKISDVKDYDLILPDIGAIPEWSLKSYKALAAYKMLDLYTGYAKPANALTNSYSADLAWQLYKHHNR